MAKYNKTDWAGGINQFVDPTKVDASSEYYVLINARTRRNIVQPIHKPLDITTGLPDGGNIQGIYPIGPYQVVFINGQAYYRNFDPPNDTWNRITGFQMSATAPVIYMTTVPRSYMNFTRKAISATDSRQGVSLGPPGQASQRCAIVMDGENQPWIIFPDATARRAKTYNEWSKTDREYVPAGCILPMYFGGILYCVGVDENGVHNTLYRSVTGRPLDFVVAVDANGDRTTTDEVVGGAAAMSYQADFGAVTVIAPSQSTNDAFVLCTTNNSYLIIPDYTTSRMIFNEPVFSKQPLFPIGALNDQCVVDVLADTAIIHYSGIRSFNAILNLKFEGKNAPFSRYIDGLISDIIQTNAAAISFDNYTLFSVETKYGPAILWYDVLTEKYASIDQFDGIGLVKQFSVVLTRTARRLFFVTTSNKVYEYFGSSEVAPVKMYVKDFTPQDGNSEHSIAEIYAQFSPVRTAGYVQASVIVDGRIVSTKAQQLDASAIVTGDFIPIPYQLSSDGNPVNVPVKFGFKEASVQGNRTGAILEWTADADLRECVVETSESTAPMPEQAKAKPAARITPTTVFFLGCDGTLDTGRGTLNRKMKQLNPDYIIGLGNHAYESGTQEQIDERLIAYWNNIRSVNRYFAVPGNTELDTDNGEPFYSSLRQSPTRYFKIATSWADIFMMNSGYNTDGTQVEPDNLTNATVEDSRQMRWLRAQLLLSGAKHRIVVWHHSPWCSAGSDDGGQLLRNIPLADWGATCQIGARPLYERLRVDDMNWFVSGAGATSKLAASATAITGSQAMKIGTLGYLRFTIWPTSIESAFVDVNGVEYDNFLMHR